VALARLVGAIALMGAASGVRWKPFLLAALAGAMCAVWSLREPSNEMSAVQRGSITVAPQGPQAPHLAPEISHSKGVVLRSAETDVDRWLAGTESADANTRLASIHSLAQAPRDRAVPILLRIAERGMLARERGAALDALQAQAQKSGDADDAIHSVLRTIAVDGRDDHISERALRMLESIDAGAAL